jgi:hypothetical protein
MARSEISLAKKLTRSEARERLPDDLRETFDNLCDETLAWSRYYYGTYLISLFHTHGTREGRVAESLSPIEPDVRGHLNF